MNTIEHLLTTLAEEGGEVGKECQKACRFGLDDKPPGHSASTPTNREKITQELNDLLGVAALLVEAGVLPADWQSPAAQARKMDKVRGFMEYARKRGTLTDTAGH